jgi:hypothetical protein
LSDSDRYRMIPKREWRFTRAGVWFKLRPGFPVKYHALPDAGLYPRYWGPTTLTHCKGPFLILERWSRVEFRYEGPERSLRDVTFHKHLMLVWSPDGTFFLDVGPWAGIARNAPVECMWETLRHGAVYRGPEPVHEP